jgi:hypothetical protein
LLETAGPLHEVALSVSELDEIVRRALRLHHNTIRHLVHKPVANQHYNSWFD